MSKNVTRAFMQAPEPPVTMSGKDMPKIDPKEVPEGHMLRHRVSIINLITCGHITTL